MSEINSGGNAFPYCVWVGDRHNGHNTGMTLREWFAGMALQVMTKNISLDDFERLKPEELAKGAFVIADAMIRAGKGEK